jgi:hypothetical protein
MQDEATVLGHREQASYAAEHGGCQLESAQLRLLMFNAPNMPTIMSPMEALKEIDPVVPLHPTAPVSRNGKS